MASTSHSAKYFILGAGIHHYIVPRILKSMPRLPAAHKPMGPWAPWINRANGVRGPVGSHVVSPSLVGPKSPYGMHARKTLEAKKKER